MTKVPQYRALVLNDQPMTVGQRNVTTPELAANFYRTNVPDSPRFTPGVENMVVVMVNTRRNVIGWQVMSTGTLDTLLCHPREVFKLAILANAAAIILFHNHPSGDPTPSEGDVKVTRDLIRAGQLLKIDLLDHIVMGEATQDRPQDYLSLRELGYFYT